MHALVILSVLILAGEPVRFSADLRPRFTDNQIRNSTAATRDGLAKWAATEHGRKLIERFRPREHRVVIIEDATEGGAGRAPQPGLATLIAATDHSTAKGYELILNPSFFRIPDGMTPLPNQAITPADMMAAAWAGEMLHISFYAQGISLPHHHRADFQREWRVMAAELGMAAMEHDDDADLVRPRRQPGSVRTIGMPHDQ